MDKCHCWSSTLGPLLFLIYINDLSEGPSTNAKLFTDDTSLSEVSHDSQISENVLQKDLEMIHNRNGKCILTQTLINKLNKEVIFILKTKNYLILP